jgi:hypothetical protein
MSKVRKCTIWFVKNKRYCKKPVFITLKVRVFHPDTLRKSTQTWYLCFEHWMIFKENPQDWYCSYKNGKPDAPVIDYRIF